MTRAIEKAIYLIFNPSEELINILASTAKLAFSSSLISLFLGVTIGLCLASSKRRLKEVLIVINRTLVGIPPVVCGLILFILFSGVGPFRHLNLMFTIRLMIIAQVLLITPIVVSNMETYVKAIITPIKETCISLGFSKSKMCKLIFNESLYQIFSTYLIAFSRAIAEVGAVSMVGGAIAWKTNVMTTAIMMYTNRGDFTLGVALGIILLILSLFVNIIVSLLQRKVSE